MAGSVKFEYRSKDDPRFKDRRMQNLLSKIEESLDKYNTSHLT